MTDNPFGDLRRRIDAARETADRSADPYDFRVLRALEAAETAQVVRMEHQVADAVHGAPDTADLPPWSQVSKPGELSYGPFVPRDTDNTTHRLKTRQRPNQRPVSFPRSSVHRNRARR